MYFKVIWVLAPYYELKVNRVLKEPIMDMETYKKIWDTHRRPYIYSIQSSRLGGEVCIVGLDHTKDRDHPSLDSIKYYWDHFKPDIALVEGRVGNLITWFQDPISTLGEGGLVTSLANQNGVKLYSWESKQEQEITLLLKTFTAEEIAMFYVYRPYFSNYRYGPYDDPAAALQEYLESRTDHPKIRGVFKNWEELDQKWKRDFPNIDWRNYGSGNGYPEGYLHEIWNQTNLIRDQHMVATIIELVEKGNKVLVTMGVSHAPRIEQTLKIALE